MVEAIAQLPEATVLMSSADGVPQYIVGDLGKVDPTHLDDQLAADQRIRPALAPLLKAFRLRTDDLVLRKVSVDENGSRHFRYDQKLRGLDVVGSDLIVHIDIKGAIFGINGTARGDIAPSLGAIAISESAANARIAADARYEGLTITGSRMVYVQLGDGSIHKAYEQIVEGQRGADPIRDKVFVDVTTGDIVEVLPIIHNVRNRLVYSANNGTVLPGTLQRSESGGPTGDIDVNAAFDALGATYDAYKLFFGRDSCDGAGATMSGSVHYSVNYCNAFWNGNLLVYGDGDPAQSCLPPARSVCVTAHEATHAVTDHESGLIYSGEPGGLNESYSDIFAAFVVAYVDGGSNGTLAINSSTFLIGDDVLPPFIRNMCDPAADGVSRDIWTSDLGSVDVHYGSGPNNLVFCLLTKGGTHPRGKTTTNVPAIGMDAAIRIFYKAQVDLLTSSSNYATMRTAATLAAQQLGYSQATVDAVGCAYAAIGVGTAPGSCGGAPPPDCVLSNGVATANMSDSVVGNFQYCKLDVPAGQSTVTFKISGGTGDADLYVSYGSKPTLGSWQCRPYLSGNVETCTFTPPSAGTYWVGLRAYAAYSGVTLIGSYDPYLANNQPVNLSGASGSTLYYRVAVPGTTTLTVRITGGTGDADLYTRFGEHPTLAAYACRPYTSTSTETCTHASATAGDWYIMVRGFTAYSGVQLVASY
ncbi:MAG TPA: pre-peptidase C-terminal domain-containing protein [Kofleriaceae bacterium]|nr:pre-peptidase C-terminal domain-containing protein [Kofleriaceae bacterium]